MKWAPAFGSDARVRRLDPDSQSPRPVSSRRKPAHTDGRLWTYIYELHQLHAFNRERFTTKTWGMFVHAWPAVMLVLLGLLSRGLARLPARIRAIRGQMSAHGRLPSLQSPETLGHRQVRNPRQGKASS